MKLEQSFDVAAPVDRVWTALIDIERVAPCLPGAAISGRNDDGSYNGTFTVKIGPTTAAYSGKLEMEEVDESGRSATIQAQGTDRRGQGGAKATIVSKVTPGARDGAHVAVSTDLHITGRLARFGRGGMIEDISERVMRQFADNLQAALSGTPEGGGAAVPDEISSTGAEAAAAGAGAKPEDQAQLAAALDAAPAAPGPETVIPSNGAEAEPLPEGAGAAEPSLAEAALASVVDAAPAGPGPETTVSPADPGFNPPASSEPFDAGSAVGGALIGRLKRHVVPAGLLLGFVLALVVFLRGRKS